MSQSYYLAAAIGENGKLWPNHVSSAPLFRFYDVSGTPVKETGNLKNASCRSDVFYPEKLADGLDNCRVLLVGQICRKWKCQAVEEHQMRVFLSDSTEEADTLVQRYIPSIID